jgi:hypothetical protein
LIFNVCGEEIPVRAWRDMTGSFGSTGVATGSGMWKIGFVSLESRASLHGFLFFIKELGLLTNPVYWIMVLDATGSYMYIVL